MMDKIKSISFFSLLLRVCGYLSLDELWECEIKSINLCEAPHEGDKERTE